MERDTALQGLKRRLTRLLVTKITEAGLARHVAKLIAEVAARDLEQALAEAACDLLASPRSESPAPPLPGSCDAKKARPAKCGTSAEPKTMAEVAPETVLTVAQLAQAVGPRRANRPTNVETARAWMLQGIQGVFLHSWLDLCVRKTTWGDYVKFRAEVARVKEAERKRLREVVKGLSRREEKARKKRAEDAKRRLEEMGLR
ncbi:MAG TPA: hypothetical protein VN688_00995 [Gemmataceae bacterium]|nr:hypothetical protein [Gemmataceae bacterium]